MEQGYIELSYMQVGIAALLILVNGLISFALGLGLAQKLFFGALRMTVQLLLIGYFLHWVFDFDTWYAVAGVMLIMTLTAGVSAVGRTKFKYRGIVKNSVVSIWLSSWFVTLTGLIVIVQVHPWFSPQYSIPLLGMILGNTLNGISLGMDRFTSDLLAKRGQVETHLSLGATSWEAARELVADAVRTGMIPIVNLMMVAGIVSLPGMMTGQLLAGVQPVQAVKYQIVVIFLIAAGTALGTLGGVLLGFKHLFNKSHQFLYQELT